MMKRKIFFKGVASAALFFILGSMATAQISITSVMIQQHQTQPGKTIKGFIDVLNSGKIPHSAKVFCQPLKMARDCGAWIKFSDQNLLIDAGSTARVRYTAKVPAGTKGSYFTKFVVQPLALRRVKMKTGLIMEIRLAGWIVLTVPGGIKEAEFSGIEYKEKTLLVKMKNTGTIALRPALFATVAGNEVKARERLLLPGKAMTWPLKVDLPRGPHSVVIFADGIRGQWATHYKLVVNGGAPDPLKK